ncbi:MAG: NifU family protein [Erysipelotrichaceae bacterium]|jgi:Fe-S cluster biogenesis protein NfuA
MDLTFEEQIIDVLEKIRPYLQRDGGDVEFVRLEENGRVVVRVFGACVGCSAIDSTIKLGVEALLMDEVVGVSEVVVED